MVRFRLSGLVLTCVLAQFLAAPTLGIMLQDESQLAEFHRHALSPWPSSQLLFVDPVSFVHAAEKAYSERLFPVQLATHAQKTALLHWFNEAPEPRVSLGEDGHIFLNGASNEALYGLFVTGCLSAHSDSAARSLEAALQYWSNLAKSTGWTPDFVVIPTAASLYADKLPNSTPSSLRAACLERMAGRSALLSVRPPEHSPAIFVYPLREMLGAKHDPGFYPKGNWHPVGKSLQVVRDAYLAKLGLRQSVRETLHPEVGPAEILLTYGIDWPRPLYVAENPSVYIDAERDALVRRAITPLFRGARFVTHAYRNEQPALEQTALLVTDSFGDQAAAVFAAAFRSLIQVNINDLLTARPSQVIDSVRGVVPFDRVVFLIQEGNAPALAHWR